MDMTIEANHILKPNIKSLLNLPLFCYLKPNPQGKSMRKQVPQGSAHFCGLATETLRSIRGFH